jgi:hypothetical protein
VFRTVHRGPPQTDQDFLFNEVHSSSFASACVACNVSQGRYESDRILCLQETQDGSVRKGVRVVNVSAVIAAAVNAAGNREIIGLEIATDSAIRTDSRGNRGEVPAND